MVFTAKHRNSSEVQSRILTVRKFATKVRFEKPGGWVEGKGMAPNEYYDGTQWKKMPVGFVPADGEYSALGFEKKGEKFVQVGGTADWPEIMRDELRETRRKRCPWKNGKHVPVRSIPVR